MLMRWVLLAAVGKALEVAIWEIPSDHKHLETQGNGLNGPGGSLQFYVARLLPVLELGQVYIYTSLHSRCEGRP